MHLQLIYWLDCSHEGAAVLVELFTFLTGNVRGPHTGSLWIKEFLLLLETFKIISHHEDLVNSVAQQQNWQYNWQLITATGTSELHDKVMFGTGKDTY